MKSFLRQCCGASAEGVLFVCRRQTVIFDENATVWAPNAVEDVKKEE